MSVHTFRLRAGWLWWAEGATEASAERVDLPAAWINEYAGPLRLARSFHRPLIDAGSERLELRLAEVPGLVEVRFNGRPLAEVDPVAVGPTVVPLPAPLPPRNRVELRAECPSRHGFRGDRPPWGEIALVIQTERSARAEDHPL